MGRLPYFKFFHSQLTKNSSKSLRSFLVGLPVPRIRLFFISTFSTSSSSSWSGKVMFCRYSGTRFAPSRPFGIAKTLYEYSTGERFTCISSPICTTREGFTAVPATKICPFLHASVAKLRVLYSRTSQRYLSIRVSIVEFLKCKVTKIITIYNSQFAIILYLCSPKRINIMYKKIYILFLGFFICCCVNAQVKQEPPKEDYQIIFPRKTFDNPPLPQKPQEQKKSENQPVKPQNPSSKSTLVRLENADSLLYNEHLTGDAQVLMGNVTFSHDGVFLYCDSACWYQQNNSFNAFGNVVINQGDTLFVYGDVLFYDGNTKLARLRENVLMDNLTATLTTDSLNFDRVKNVGYYFDGGIIKDSLNTLTSETGHYYPGTKDAVFKRNVVLTNPDFVMKSDTLRYNVDTKVAFIVGPTNIIYDKETHIYSEYGWYNTETEQSKLLKNSYVFHNSGKKLVADTIFYDKKSGKGEGFTKVVIIDTVKMVALHGNYGYYIENQEIGVVTDSAMMVEYSSKDTLFLHADTLYTRAETFKIPILDTVFIKNEVIPVQNDTLFGQNVEFPVKNDTLSFENNTILNNDTILNFDENKNLLTEEKTFAEDTLTLLSGQISNDSILQTNLFSLKIDTVWRDSTYKIFQGYPNVRFWRTNVQGVCDSSYYDTRDSVLHLLTKPIIWSDSRQLSGDTIRIYPKNGDIDNNVFVKNNAFVCEFVEDKHFNQLSGKEIIGYIINDKLKKVDVKGNAESLYYPQDEEDKSIIGLVNTASSIMNIFFTDDNAIERISISPKPTGSMNPLKDLKDDMLFLHNYSWQISKKPISKDDIFRNTNAIIRDSLSAENQDIDNQPKKKTTRRENVKPVEEQLSGKKNQGQNQEQGQSPTRSTDSNRPSGFATPSLGGVLGSGKGGGGGALKQKSY